MQIPVSRDKIISSTFYLYDKSFEPQVVQIMDAITAYDAAASGETYILVLNQALRMLNQEPSLFCPNQLRHNGLIVNECPPQWRDPKMEHPHSIIFPNKDVISPLEMTSIMSGFSTRKPTELEIDNCIWLTLTSTQIWDPSSNELEEQEKRKKIKLTYLLVKVRGGEFYVLRIESCLHSLVTHKFAQLYRNAGIHWMMTLFWKEC
jgi:hypothetical protein